MREEILKGNLPLPSKDKFILNVGEPVTELVEQLFQSLWYNYCANKGTTSTIYWIEKVGMNRGKFLGALKALVTSNWVTLDTRDNFSSIGLNELKLLQFVSQNELDTVRYSMRFYKYLPYANQSTQHGLATVRVFGKPTERKLSRPGMEIGAKSMFSFDRTALNKHYGMVREEARKGVEKTLQQHPQMADDHANYAEVVDGIIEHLASEDVVCNMGVNYVDSRGRAIKSHLDKVMNPIGFKVARALLVIPD